ncbi:MAG: NADP-dependent phosphogluconate dehydrogenase [Chloroflexota bacterium]|nr:MAG: NADP-dependent phosphogluconate dehydrogenase [Chloroflexota bacterium]
MAGSSVGLIGLAVMGENLALNIANNGFQISVYNRTRSVTEKYAATSAVGKPVTPTYSLVEFVSSIDRPRRIAIMVQAGAPVDAVLNQLLPLLAPGDLVMDCGNSYFPDTARRSAAIEPTGIHYFGVGVSGGEEGALKGPAIMPGGPAAAYPLIEPILTKIAAKVPDGACVAYMGTGAAGHYVKMVHNGIEYGDMQLIAEAYDLLSRAGGFSAPELGAIFEEWNQGELDSYLIEITATVLKSIDVDTGKPMVDVILDQAGQKGTGRWTAQDALELGIPIPTIEAALWARNISAFKDERVTAAKSLRGPSVRRLRGAAVDKLVAAVRQALYASKVASYAQGMALLAAASAERSYNLNLGEIARIWKGGCIIRARLLNEIQSAYSRDAGLTNLLLDRDFREAIDERQAGWRHAVRTARALGIPCPATSASLDYYDSYRTARLSANLLQGQRDYFGAHTYQRVDRPGTFHTEWLDEKRGPRPGTRLVSSDPAGPGSGH